MGEGAGFIFTVALFVVAFVGAGAYAVVGIADFKSARRGFVAATIIFAGLGVVLAVMTTWSLPTRITIAAVFAAVAFGSLVWVLDYLKVRERLGIANESQTETETGRLVSQAQFAKVAELESFLGGKDENGLRQVFDIPNILQKNVNAQLTRMAFIKSGKEKEFFYTNYSDNGNVIFWAKEGHFSVGPSGVHVDAGPKDVLFLVTTSKFQEAQDKIVGFLNSALIPDSIKEPLNAFNDVVNKIPELMMSILDERMHQDENFFIHNMEMGTPFYGVIVSEFATKTPHLKQPADRVLGAIAASWKISK
jgi:hypothetical protein